jgi:hypothetical protein
MDSETRELTVQCMRLVARLRTAEWSALRALRCCPSQFVALTKAASDENGDWPQALRIVVHQSDLVMPGVVQCIGPDGQVLGALRL